MRAIPPLRLLAVFETVVRNGGVKAAAKAFNVSPAAISQSLKQLESYLGATLLDRSTRPPKLTPHGRALREACATGLKTIENCVDEIRASTETAQRSITIACSIGTATYWLMPRLSNFYQVGDDITINVMTTTSGAPALTGGVDIAIRYGRDDWRDGVSRLLFREEVAPVCSPEFRRCMNSLDATLETLPLIHVDVEDRNWLGWSEYFKLTGQTSKRRNPNLRFTNYVQATQAALTSQGVMLGWRAVTGDFVTEGRLVRASEKYLHPTDAHYAVTLGRSSGAKSIQTVCDWLVEEGGETSSRAG